MASETLQIIVTATDNASGVLGKVSSALSSMTKIAGGILLADTINKISDSVGTFLSDGTNMLVFLQRMNFAFTEMVAAEYRASDATMTVGESLKYAAGHAQYLSDWMIKLAIQSPFETADIAKTFRIGKMYGFTSLEIQKLTQQMVDMAAATGSTPFMMERVSLALGQIRLRGKLTGQEIRQLAEAGFPVGEMFSLLAERAGKTIPEMQALQEKGLIPAKDALIAISDVMNKNFAGAAKNQMTTLAGLISTFSDLRQISGAKFMGGLLAPFQEQLQSLIMGLATPEFYAAAERLGYRVAYGIKAGIDGVKGIWDGLTRLFAPIISRVQQFTNKFRAAMVRGLSPLKAFVSAVRLEFGDGIANALQTVINIIQAFATVLRNTITKLFSGDIAGAIRAAFGDDIANAILPALQKIGDIINQYILPLLDKLFGGAGNNPEAFVQKILAIGAAFTVLSVLSGPISLIVSLLGPLGTALRGVGFAGGILWKVLAPLGGILTGLASSVGGFLSFLGAVGGGIVSAFSGALSLVSGALLSLGGSIGSVSSLLGGFVSSLGVVGAIIATVIGALSPIGAIVAVAVGAILLLGGAFSALQNSTTIVSNVMGGLSSAFAFLVPWISQMAQLIGGVLVPMIAMFIGIIAQAIIKVGEFLLSLVGISGGFAQLGGAINEAVVGIGNLIGQALDGIKQQFMAWLQQVINLLKFLGADVSGLQSQLDAVKVSATSTSSAVGGLGTQIANTGTAVADAGGGLDSWISKLLGTSDATGAAADAAYAHVAALREEQQFLSASRLYDKYVGDSQKQMAMLLKNDVPLEEARQFIIDKGMAAGEEFGESIMDGTEQGIEKKKKHVKTAMEKVADEVKKMLGNIITPTAVTQEDLDASAVGKYVDKWDEFRRRLEAVNTGTDISSFGDKFAKQFKDVQAIFKDLNPEQIAAKFKDFSLFADKMNFQKLLGTGVIDFSSISAQLDSQIDGIIGKANLLGAAFEQVWSSMSEQKKVDLANALGFTDDDITQTEDGVNKIKNAVTGLGGGEQTAAMNGAATAAGAFGSGLNVAKDAATALPNLVSGMNGPLQGLADKLTKEVNSPLDTFKAAIIAVKDSFAALKGDVPETITAVGGFPKVLTEVQSPMDIWIVKLKDWISANDSIVSGIQKIIIELQSLATVLSTIDLGPFQRHSPSPFEQSITGANEDLEQLLRLIPQVDFSPLHFADMDLVKLSAEGLANILFGLRGSLTELGNDPTKWGEINGELETALGLFTQIRDAGVQLPAEFSSGLVKVIDDLTSIGKIAPDVARQMKDKISEGTAAGGGAAAAADTNLQPVVDAINKLSDNLEETVKEIAGYFEQIVARVEGAIERLMPQGLSEAWMEVANAISFAASRLSAMTLPSFLVHHSPSELEMALWGSANALSAINVASRSFSMGELGELTNISSGTGNLGVGFGQQVPSTVRNENTEHNYYQVDKLILQDVQNPREIYRKLKQDADKHKRMGA